MYMVLGCKRDRQRAARSASLSGSLSEPAIDLFAGGLWQWSAIGLRACAAQIQSLLKRGRPDISRDVMHGTSKQDDLALEQLF